MQSTLQSGGSEVSSQPNAPISAEEARGALLAIEEATARMRRAIHGAGGAYHLILWGAIWSVGYLATAFLRGSVLQPLWLGLSALGAVGSFAIGARQGRRLRQPFGARIALFWLVLFAYAGLWAWLLHPPNGRLLNLFLVTVAMFGYVVMGLWLDRVFLWIGLATTCIALVAFFAFPDAYALWMAVFGGGALWGSGLYMLRRWRG